MKGCVDLVGWAAGISRRKLRSRIAVSGAGVVALHDQAQSALLDHVAGFGVDPRDRGVIVGMLIAMSMRSRCAIGVAAGLLAEAAEDQTDVEIGGW